MDDKYVRQASEADRADLANARLTWSDAANRRLQAIRDGRTDMLGYVSEKLNDAKLRLNEAAQKPAQGFGVMNGPNPLTQARSDALEQALKQAQDQTQAVPTFNPDSSLNK